MEKGEGPRVASGHEVPQSGTPEVGTVDGVEPRRIAVFIDYWYVYTTARQLFAAGGPHAPTWFGNVTPWALGRTLVKRPPAASRRSQRELASVHIFIRHYDPEVHRGQQDRVDRWRAAGAEVHVGPSREEGAGFWQSSVSVAVATAVAESLARGTCDTAIVFAGDPALAPLFVQVAGDDVPSSRIELATWVGRDGAVPTTLVALPNVWCHRLGEPSFKLVIDDRRQQAPRQPKGHRRAAAGGAESTAMAAALAAAGVGRRPPAGVAVSHPAVAAAPSPASAFPGEGSALADGVVRRVTQRLFRRGASVRPT